MKFSLKYLLQFIERFPGDVYKISEQLTALGIEVESCIEDPNNKDYILEVATAPNRADLLGIIGIARELAAFNHVKLKLPTLEDDITELILDHYDEKIDAAVNITINNPEACPRYLSRIIKNIDYSKKTPDKIRSVLQHAGISLISPVVDILNYVMLELGQPMHAFDLAKISGNQIIVRNANKNEEMVLLDNNKIIMKDNDLIIADAEKPLALAGIMGGINAAIVANTKDILLECAYFEPIGIRMTSRRLNLISDAAHRFVRNIDPSLQHIAMLRASELLKEAVGGQMQPIVTKINQRFLPNTTVITLSRIKIKTIVGSCFPDHQINTILQGLKMTFVKKADVGWEVTIPSWRQDIKIQEDLIEEIVRFIGYNNIVPQKVSLPLGFRLPEKQLTFDKELEYKSCLVNRGYCEVITYSFISKEFADLFYSQQDFYVLKNPISQAMSIMRPGLWPGLLQAFLYNKHRQQDRIKLFELGNVFLFNSKTGVVEQNKKIAGIACGNLFKENWQHIQSKVDLFSIKSDIEAILNCYGNDLKIHFKVIRPTESHNNFIGLHVLQSAKIYIGDLQIGMLGALHPNIMNSFSIEEPIFLFEINLELLSEHNIVKFKEISKFPAIRRDFSITIDNSIASEEIVQVVQGSCDNLLKEIIFFDVYYSDKSVSNKKNIAFGVILQDLDRTLETADIVNIEAKIIQNLQKIGGSLRT